jgi:hypothetical protein
VRREVAVQVPERQGPSADHTPALGPVPDRLRPVLRPGLGADAGSARLPELHREVGVSEATFDADGYPTSESLRRISDWPYDDPVGWFRFIYRCWWQPGWGWHEAPALDDFNRPVHRYSISTGGWSGNEDVIGAMQKSFLWHLTWESSRRGGHYVFGVAEEVMSEQT